MQTQTAIAPTPLAPAEDTLLHHIWPHALIAFGLGLTVAWTCVLAYGLVTLLELSI
jgi:hypothetical protein